MAAWANALFGSVSSPCRKHLIALFQPTAIDLSIFAPFMILVLQAFVRGQEPQALRRCESVVRHPYKPARQPISARAEDHAISIRLQPRSRIQNEEMLRVDQVSGLRRSCLAVPTERHRQL